MKRRPQTSERCWTPITREPLIVGIDPGNTSAVAALNFDGEIVLRTSEREFPHHEIIETLVDVGKPVVLACDTEKMPSTVEKIAASMGAERFKPEEDLDRQRKEDLGDGDNSHEKDAHAAAEHAYRNLRKSIEKVNRRCRNGDFTREELAERFMKDRLHR